MAAMALNSVGIAVLALMAALYHTFNHAMFKGELFLGAGALLYSTGTRNMEKMGGLFRRMPATAICFLIGALAISAIPPFNGFVSEWFTYQSLFNAAMFAQGLLAAICVVLGIGAPVIAPVLVDVAASVLHPYGGVFAAEGMELMNQYSGAATSTPAIAIALVVLVGLACGYRKLKTVGKVQKSQPWACGYAPNEHMPLVATTFASEVSWFMQPLYTLRDRCTAVCWSIAHFFQKLTGVAEAVEPVPDKVLVDAPHKGVEKLADLATKLEGGNYSIYICYIVAALVVFLVLAVQMG